MNKENETIVDRGKLEELIKKVSKLSKQLEKDSEPTVVNVYVNENTTPQAVAEKIKNQLYRGMKWLYMLTT